MKTPAHWQSNGALAHLLTPLSWLYGLAGSLRRSGAQPWKAPVPVVCVGNLCAGGAGKTPVAIDIARRLHDAGTAAHLLTRGYGGTAIQPLQVDTTLHDWRRIGDEAQLLSAAAPTWVAADRKAGAQAATQAGAGAIVMDDGFQNPQLVKTLSLLIVDGGVGFGNGRLIPAGPLRESLAGGLARADALVVLGRDETGVSEKVARIAPNLPILTAHYEPKDADAFRNSEVRGCKVLAFAGIGRPEKFFETLKRLGADVVETHAFGDHHPYRTAEIEAMITRAEEINAIAVTTAKDAVKLSPEQRIKVEVLDITVAWDNPEIIDTMLKAVMDAGLKND